MKGLQRAQRVSLYVLPDQSFGAIRRQAKPHQRARKFLGPGKVLHAQVQRCSEGTIRAIFERMRVAI